jgi:2-succinyl-5-enolpyruvyl-6-hydroxy-3-cyclohexene-1-carboxylate synthase
MSQTQRDWKYVLTLDSERRRVAGSEDDLAAAIRRGADLRIVVLDNNGGGIFSFLPQATELPSARYEQLFGTPLGSDLVGLARAHGLEAHTVTAANELVDRLAQPGPWMVRVPSDRDHNVEVHRALHAAVADALR